MLLPSTGTTAGHGRLPGAVDSIGQSFDRMGIGRNARRAWRSLSATVRSSQSSAAVHSDRQAGRGGGGGGGGTAAPSPSGAVATDSSADGGAGGGGGVSAGAGCAKLEPISSPSQPLRRAMARATPRSNSCDGCEGQRAEVRL